jgi:hypothetical protein
MVDTVGTVQTAIIFLGALVGAAFGAYAGVTIERLRGRREAAVQRRDDVRQGIIDVNQHAAAALRICADLEATDHWPTLYGEDWRALRAKQLPGEATDMLVALSRVELFLADTSEIERRAHDYFSTLVAADEDGEPAAGRLARASAAHTALTGALRDELERLETASDQIGAARVLSPLSSLASRVRAGAYPGRET